MKEFRDQFEFSLSKAIVITGFCFLTACASSTPKREVPEALKSDLPARIKTQRVVTLKNPFYVTLYNQSQNIAYFSEYVLKASDLKKKNVKRSNRFHGNDELKNLNLPVVPPAWYLKSGYDKGHLAPSADFAWSTEANDETFLMSNMTPQKPKLNRIAWKALENAVRGWACFAGEVRVVTGPILENDLPQLNGHPLPIPKKFFKVIVDLTPPGKAIGFILSQDDTSVDDYKEHVVTVGEVERQTGLDMLADTSGVEKAALETHATLSEWQSAKCSPKRTQSDD